MTAAPITSAGRFCPWGPLGIGYLTIHIDLVGCTKVIVDNRYLALSASTPQFARQSQGLWGIEWAEATVVALVLNDHKKVLAIGSAIGDHAARGERA